MTTHLLQVWFESDEDPSDIDWQTWLPNWIDIKSTGVRSFPWNGVEHEITWWITRRLSPDEWNDLDNAECEVLARIVGEDHFVGTAGPIPEELEGER